jgi:hypothetical protein
MQNLFNSVIAMPESFEWLLLKIRYGSDRFMNLKLDKTYNYADSEKYLTWEKYYTDLIQTIDLNYFKGLEVDTVYLADNCVNNLLQLFNFVDLSQIIVRKIDVIQSNKPDDSSSETHYYKEV